MTTHLHGLAIDPTADLPIQQAQAKELLATATLSPLPVVVAADFNVDADNNDDPTYRILTGADFKDAWKEKNPSIRRPTCCQDPKLDNPESSLSLPAARRFDLVLYRGNVTLQDIKVVGDKPEDRTPSRLWPSDHAGVVKFVGLPKLLYLAMKMFTDALLVFGHRDALAAFGISA